jgi:TRAP-type C4-dicarboxylate transport system substrate-binding protein
MAWGELLTALQQGTVDGCDAPLSVLYTNGFPDVCKYIDNVNLFYSPLPVCISTSVFESFSAEDQQLLRDAAVEAGLADPTTTRPPRVWKQTLPPRV